MDGAITNELSLDHIGILEGTDKTSLAVDYLRHYERILREVRNEPIQLMEIGVAEGASLRTWERFLPSASIIGVDNNEACRLFAGGRVTVEIGSQADPAFLSALAAKYKPNVIIDDGSHQSAHIFLTFDHLFPALALGGIYVIEDVYLHHDDHAPTFHGQGGVTPTEHFATAAARLTSRDSEADKMIDHIEFIPSAIVIYKRADIGNRLDYLFGAAQQAEKSLTWYHLSWTLMNANDLERAEFAAQRAVALDPDRAAYWPRLSALQAQRGKVAEAIETLLEGVRRDPENASLRTTLAVLKSEYASNEEG